MELIDLQNDTELRNKFQNASLIEFYTRYFPANKFPLLATHSRQIMSLFGSTYACEQLFSKWKFKKMIVIDLMTND